MIIYNKDLKCIEAILPNGIFRKYNNGNCLFKDKNGIEDRLNVTSGMTVSEYKNKINEFSKKHGVDLDALIEFSRKNRDIINQ